MKNMILRLSQIILFFPLILMSCQQPTDNVFDNVISKPSTPATVLPTPPAPYPGVPPPVRKPYPGLDTRVSELVSAYEAGGDEAAETYAKKHRVRLEDGMVFVEIKVKPGSKAAVMDAVNNAGAKNVNTSVYFDMVDAFVPLNQVKFLADNPAIKLIMIPGGFIAD